MYKETEFKELEKWYYYWKIIFGNCGERLLEFQHGQFFDKFLKLLLTFENKMFWDIFWLYF